MVQVEALPVALLRMLTNKGNEKIACIPVGQPGSLELLADIIGDAEFDAGGQNDRPGNSQLTCVP